jgi:ABC-type transport system substrate-binding protein
MRLLTKCSPYLVPCLLLLSVSAGLSTQAQAQKLTVANTAETPSFDPQKVLGINSIVAIANMYDRLVYLDADGKIEPWLATKWTTSPDGKTWTFTLRHDAKFHDGTPVTAAAVKFSFDRAIGPNAPSSLARTYLRPIEKVETPDDYTVVITTKRPFAPLLNHLGHQTVGAILNPAVVAANNGDISKAVDAGSGMYKLVSWSRNNQLVLERNDGWWGPKPGYAQIIYKPVPQVGTRVIMIEKGEAGIVTNIPNFESDRLQRNKTIKVTATQSIRSMYFAFNFKSPVLQDVKVRQAINYAVNIDGIIKAVMGGHGTRSRSLITANLPFYYPAYDFTYDVAKAKTLLKEANVAPGTKLVLISPKGNYPMDSEIAQAVAGNLRDVGFDVEMRIVGDWGQYQQTMFGGQFDLGLYAWAPGSLDADGTFSPVLSSAGFNNFGKYASPEADQLIKQGTETLDPAARAEIYKKLQELIGRDVPYLLLNNVVSFSATRANVCGVHVRSDEAVILKDARPC